ncbi:MAG: ABC transporter substrate-binding protein [Lentisphaerales bacterium]|nr:ABC transporter substrate-binding protein [Lentisphaerales bacterium]
MKKIWLILFSLIILSSCERQSISEVSKELRIITVGSKATEIIYELGLGESIVARDYHSLYPSSVSKLPELGFAHSINLESFITHKPTHLVIWDEIGTYKKLIEKSAHAGISVLELSPNPGVVELRQSIQDAGKLFSREEQASALLQKVTEDLKRVSDYIDAKKLDGKGLFIFAKGMGTMLAAGQKTDADEFMGLVGLETAINGFNDYKAINAEIVIEANPKYLLMVHVGLESIGGINQLKNIPGLSKTTAFKENNIITMDKVCMEFGPRIGQFALEFAKKLHGDIPALQKEN